VYQGALSDVSRHFCALTDPGTMVCVGLNGYDQAPIYIICILLFVSAAWAIPHEKKDVCEGDTCGVGGPLSQSQIQLFHDLGFLILENFFTDAEVKQLEQAAIMTEQSKESVRGVWKYYNMQENGSVEEGKKKKTLDRVEAFVDVIPGWDLLGENNRIGKMVGQLFGEPAFLWKEKINFKKPDSPSGFEAHQDVQAGWSENGMSLHITVGISIDRTTVENGCIQFSPHTHTKGMLGPIRKAIPSTVVESIPWIKVPTTRKTIIVFGSYVPHKSDPNKSGSQRRFLLATYAKKSEETIESRKEYYEKKKKFAPPDIFKEPKKNYRGYLI
jgi:2-aminoethylphosphonate dioxygenase